MWPQPAEFRSWKIIFKSEVSHSSQCPRAAILWIGEVEDAKNIDDLITFKHLQQEDQFPPSRISTSRLQTDWREFRTGNLKKQVTTAEGKAQSETRSLSGRPIAWIMFELSKTNGDNEAILDFGGLSSRTKRFRPSTQSGTKVLSSVIDRPTDSRLESLYKTQVEKLQNEIFVASQRSEDDIRRQENVIIAD